MAYDRAAPGRYVWIKSVGAANDMLEPAWLEAHAFLLESVWFPKHPRSLRAGDLLVYYAAGRGVFPAVVEIVSDEVQEARDHPRYAERWPWRMEVRPRVVLPSLDGAPRVDEVGIDPLRLRRQSHILLNAGEWDRFRESFLPRVDVIEPVARSSA